MAESAIINRQRAGEYVCYERKPGCGADTPAYALLIRLAAIEDAAVGSEDVLLSGIRRLSGGEHHVRVWREYRGLSLRELARQAEV